MARFNSSHDLILKETQDDNPKSEPFLVLGKPFLFRVLTICELHLLLDPVQHPENEQSVPQSSATLFLLVFSYDYDPIKYMPCTDLHPSALPLGSLGPAWPSMAQPPSLRPQTQSSSLGISFFGQLLTSRVKVPATCSYVGIPMLPATSNVAGFQG